VDREEEAEHVIDAAFVELAKSKVDKGFVIYDSRLEDDSISFGVKPRYSDEMSFSTILKEFGDVDYFPIYRKVKDGLRISIVQRKEKKREIKPRVNMVLLILTAITMTLAGYVFWAEGNIAESIMFAVALMGILGGHELGHALMARRRGINATLPFFIPVPPPIFPFGTLGAVIFMGSPVPNRKSLLDVGVTGPLAGFILSLPVLIVGLKLSEVTPVTTLPEEGTWIFGIPLLLQFLVSEILGHIPAGYVIIPHPLAIAGWAGLFVTSLNLFPVGQLDGGHVIRAVLPRGHETVFRVVVLFLIVLGLLVWPGWLMWALFVTLLTRLRHPGPLDDVSELDQKRRLAAILALIIFILCFMPVPAVYLSPGDLSWK
jgi:Zn-dependent protease